MCLSKCSSQSPVIPGQLALLSEAFLPLSALRKTVVELRMWSRETTEQLLPPLEMCSGCWESRCYAEGNETIQQKCLESFAEVATAQLTRNWAVSRVVADLTELWPVKVLQMESCKTCKDWEVINEMEQKIRLDMNLRPRHDGCSSVSGDDVFLLVFLFLFFFFPYCQGSDFASGHAQSWGCGGMPRCWVYIHKACPRRSLLLPGGRSSMPFQKGTLGKIPWPLLCLLCWD